MRLSTMMVASIFMTGVHTCVLAESPAASDTPTSRIVASVDGTTLTGTNGGGGASLGWLLNFGPSTVASVSVEHQALANAHWTFGSLYGTAAAGPDTQRYNFYGEVHEGAGHDGLRAFDYHIEAAGVFATFDHRFTAQLEDRRIDVENTHGNLPKAGVSYLWGGHLSTAVSYQYSGSGNLGTRVWSARVDHFGRAVNLLAGGSYGPTLPTTFDLPSGTVSQVHLLREGFVGVSKPFPSLRGEFTLVADFIDLSGIKRATFTLTYIYHV
ncbi:MAG TPA: hypothetical protein VGD54_07635 [Steroidobacteraceae bacterium]